MFENRFKHLKQRYDLIIIGGGIHGAALAWEATSRGLQTLLLEQNDFASGTSANSLKVIHGGIRYLQDLDFARMRSSIKERKTLLRIAPNLVRPLPCVMPTYRSLGKSRLALGTGMTIYDMVAWDRNRHMPQEQLIPSRKILSLQQLRSIMPPLADDSITGGACWFDAQVFNSERLVLAFLMTAKEHGADVFNYLHCKNYLTESGRIRGVLAEDALSGRQLEIIGDQIADCTGPWAVHNQIYQQLVQPLTGKTQARACNILIKRHISDYALGFKSRPASDGTDTQTGSRLLFIAPWRDGSLIGTWYYADDTSPSASKISRRELQSAVKEIDTIMPSLRLTTDDISFVHCGLLPVSGVGEDDGEPPLQKHVRIISAQSRGGAKGLFWVQGVKYTTARAVAAEALRQISRESGKILKPAISDKTLLYGGHLVEPAHHQLPAATIRRLIGNYGSCSGRILHYLERQPALAEPIPGVAHSVQAELHFVLDHEMAYSLSDVLLRRTDIGSLTRPSAETIDFCSELMALRLAWNSNQRQLNIDDLLARYPNHQNR